MVRWRDVGENLNRRISTPARSAALRAARAVVVGFVCGRRGGWRIRPPLRLRPKASRWGEAGARSAADEGTDHTAPATGGPASVIYSAFSHRGKVAFAQQMTDEGPFTPAAPCVPPCSVVQWPYHGECARDKLVDRTATCPAGKVLRLERWERQCCRAHQTMGAVFSRALWKFRRCEP